MSDIVLDSDGDLDIATGSLRLNAGADAVTQHLRIRLQTFLGEWFLDRTIGVPYFQKILGTKNTSPILLNAIFRREILKSPGVLGIAALGFALNTETRELVVTALIQSADGVIDFSQTLEVT